MERLDTIKVKLFMEWMETIEYMVKMVMILCMVRPDMILYTVKMVMIL